MSKIYLLLIVILPYFLASCTVNKFVIKPEKLSWNHPEPKLIDSIYIAKVIDKRKDTSQIIGSCSPGLFEKPVPIIFKENLADYIKSNFNNLISGSKDYSKATPVLVEINNLRIDDTSKVKSSYSFSYPNNDKIIKFVFVDSLLYSFSNDIEIMVPKIFYTGIKVAADYFLWYYKNHPISQATDTSNVSSLLNDSSRIQNDNEQILTDTLMTILILIPARNVYSFGYYLGNSKLNQGISFGFNRLFKRMARNIEYGVGLGFHYFQIKPFSNYISPKLLSLNFPTIWRYYFLKDSEKSFLSGIISLNFSFDVDKSKAKKAASIFTPSLELGLGYKIGKYVEVLASVHQIYNLSSRIMPNDFGFNLNTSFTFDYK